MTEESLKGLAKTYPHYGPIDNPRAAANAICKACEWRQEVVAAVFQDVIAMLKAGKKVGSITGLLVTRARRYQQDRKAATAGAGA
jgi:4-hydroxy-3-methylbut-2-enyl diphosphate reductase IspH